MAVSSLFRYMSAAFVHKESRQLGFLRMGLGIEARAQRFRALWQEHFERSKQATRLWWSENADSEGSRNLLVLGAGRLFDFDLEFFCSEENIHSKRKLTNLCFVDADALAVPVWRRAVKHYSQTRITWRILELSGKLRGWRESFKRSLKKANWQESLKLLEEIAWCEEPRSTTDVSLRDVIQEVRATDILSLNLLSQIAVMWQDVVYQLLIDRFGRAWVDSREIEWVNAFLPGARVLLRDHLEALATSGAESILIISDVEYLYYPVVSGSDDELPFEWLPPVNDEPAHWLIKREGSGAGSSSHQFQMSNCSSFDALHGVNIENEKLFQVLAPQYRMRQMSSWLWGVCPNPERSMSSNLQSEAVCHRVAAIELRRVKTKK